MCVRETVCVRERKTEREINIATVERERERERECVCVGERKRERDCMRGRDRTEDVFKVILQKSIPTQIRQLILYICNSEGKVDGLVGELTSAQQL